MVDPVALKLKFTRYQSSCYSVSRKYFQLVSKRLDVRRYSSQTSSNVLAKFVLWLIYEYLDLFQFYHYRINFSRIKLIWRYQIQTKWHNIISTKCFLRCVSYSLGLIPVTSFNYSITPFYIVWFPSNVKLRPFFTAKV